MSSASKRKLEEEDDEDAAPRNLSGKALFVRDSKGELVTVLPGQLMPAKVEAASAEAAEAVAEAAEQHEAARLAARSEEDVQYEAYLNGRDAKGGNVWIPNAGKASSDKAYFADSISAQIAAEREAAGGGEQQHAPARAYDRNAKFKKQTATSSGGTYGGATSAADAHAGASLAQAALERAREASDDEDDEESLNLTAAQLAGRAMAAYNLPVSKLPQLDPHGNDLRVPQLERKLRKFLECFAEEASIRTLEGSPVIRDFESIRKRYATVFRESGADLRGVVHRRWTFERAPRGAAAFNDDDACDDDDDDDGDDDDGGGACASFCIDFERHSSLVTPKPGLPLDGSLGVTAPRTQDLVVLYMAEGGEIGGMWIAPDGDGLGADASMTREGIEATDLFKSFRRQVDKLSGGARLAAQCLSQP